MMYKIAISILSTIIPCIIFADATIQKLKKPIERVVQVGNITPNTYLVYIKDAHGNYHEPALLPPGCTQYMFCRTKKISLISFQPHKPVGKQFQIDRPISEMTRVDCYDEQTLADHFHFYLLPNYTISSFEAASQKDLEIINQVRTHTFIAPSGAFTSPFKQKP